MTKGKFDKDEFARLVELAKGEDRSITEFAKDIGVPYTTVSRILKKKNSTASSDRVLVAIADNAAPGSMVTADMLRRANGISSEGPEYVRMRKETGARAKKGMGTAVIDERSVQDKIYEVRGMKVMLDFELAEIYGYTTKRFNEQVKNNISKFDDDFRFQITREELDDLVRSKKPVSWDGSMFKGQTGGTRYLPWCFTESGIYMLMTVLRGDFATRQSKALIRTFRAMKDFIIENQGMIGRREYLKLSMQINDSIRDNIRMRADLDYLGDDMKDMLDRLSNIVTESEIAPILLEMGNPEVKREYLLLDGQPAKADEAYTGIYAQAGASVHIVDDCISMKTLRLLRGVKSGVTVTVFSDNSGNCLHAVDYEDFKAEFPDMPVEFFKTNGAVHDRYIVLDMDTPEERMFHCGASPKDAGDKVASITEHTDSVIKNVMHDVVKKMMDNPPLILR